MTANEKKANMVKRAALSNQRMAAVAAGDFARANDLTVQMAKRFVIYTILFETQERIYLNAGRAKWVRFASLAQTFVLKSAAQRKVRELKRDGMLDAVLHVEEVQW